MHRRSTPPSLLTVNPDAERATALIAAAGHLELKMLFHFVLALYELRMQTGIPPFMTTEDALQSRQLRAELLSLVRDTEAEADLVEALVRAAA